MKEKPCNYRCDYCNKETYGNYNACPRCLQKGAMKEINHNLQQQLIHPFYKDAESFREEVKMETMKKAAEKYNEPFNPASWTIEELAKHAMAENYDQQNYIYGMYERLQVQEQRIEQLEKELKQAQAFGEYYRTRAMAAGKKETQTIEVLMDSDMKLVAESDAWDNILKSIGKKL